MQHRMFLVSNVRPDVFQYLDVARGVGDQNRDLLVHAPGWPARIFREQDIEVRRRAGVMQRGDGALRVVSVLKNEQPSDALLLPAAVSAHSAQYWPEVIKAGVRMPGADIAGRIRIVVVIVIVRFARLPAIRNIADPAHADHAPVLAARNLDMAAELGLGVFIEAVDVLDQAPERGECRDRAVLAGETVQFLLVVRPRCIRPDIDLDLLHPFETAKLGRLAARKDSQVPHRHRRANVIVVGSRGRRECRATHPLPTSAWRARRARGFAAPQ
jgi:hypothetical protein